MGDFSLSSTLGGFGTSVFGEDPSLGASYGLDDETISIRSLPGQTEESPSRELRISCPDATGLGCDISRMLLDFGISIIAGDISTDGKWCFLILEVELAPGVPARWSLLRQRLEHICPLSHSLPYLMRIKGSQPRAFQHPFLLRITASDRRSVLHSLAHCLMEADVTVFKARIRTGKAKQVTDEFWVYDNRCELPNDIRARQIQNQVRGFLRQVDASLDISPAPRDSGDEQDPGAELMQRSACKDATPSPPLRKLLSAASSQNLTTLRSSSSPTSSMHSGSQLPGRHSEQGASYSSLDGSQNGADVVAAPSSSQPGSAESAGQGHRDDREANGRRSPAAAAAESPWKARADDGPLRPPSAGSSASTSRRSSIEEEPLHGTLKLIHQDVEVNVDNSTASSYSSFIISCPNRKGLLYDIFRTFTDVQVRVAYGKVAVKPPGSFEAELFVQEVDGARILDLGMQEALVERVKRAVQQPVDIRLHDLPDASGTQLIIAAPLDSGGRGRPRVMYDVSAAVAAEGLTVQQADIRIQPIGMPISSDSADVDQNPAKQQIQSEPRHSSSSSDLQNALARPLEVHCFLICLPTGGPVADPTLRRAMWRAIRDQLIGNPLSRSNTPQQGPAPLRSKAQSLTSSFHRWRKY
ncbi:hypothetical protein WJX74_000676 [Apatococcus lobatus]|uniref:ACT domain-containing protein n=1 Tax=Apatococcus lobatus TaxID=904363 RepID=A0AAW1S1T4_9CHLO